MKAICETTGTNLKKLREDVDVKGDLAIVAESKKSTQSTIFPPPPLTCASVLDTFRKIACSSGANVLFILCLCLDDLCRVKFPLLRS
jgi:DNA ligase-1